MNITPNVKSGIIMKLCFMVSVEAFLFKFVRFRWNVSMHACFGKSHFPIILLLQTWI